MIRQGVSLLWWRSGGSNTPTIRRFIPSGRLQLLALPPVEGYVQNAPTTVAYRDAISKGQLPVVRGAALTEDDRLRRAIIERLMCDFFVDLDEITARHSEKTDFTPELAAIDELARDGLVTRRGHSIGIPEDSRLLVRNVCAVFDRYLDSGAVRHSRAI